MKGKRTAVLAGVVATLGALAFVQEGDTPQESQDAAAEIAAADPDPLAQPIAFPHDIHAGEFGMDCQYCHFSAERSVDAGIPPVATCQGCHLVVAGRNNPEEVAKVRDYAQRQEAIPWVRIYKVSDHVRFPHMRHVAPDESGEPLVQCQECHGPVQEMAVIEAVNQPLSMGWCVQCHVERDVSRDCAVCHY